jgi:phosphoribosyl-ATP pyrophosphohydrolase/phosphoribosyl-AMP cyclohydrolase
VNGAPLGPGEDDTVLAGGTVSFDERGLVPVIAQDLESGQVLMLAYADREALRLTVATGRAHYFSRSRGNLWRKGDTSGNVQHVREVVLDCDGDAVLYRLVQTGPACHTGERSCFFRPTAASQAESDAAATERGDERAPGASPDRAFALLERIVAERLRDLPEGSYVRSLHERGAGYQAQKVVEEAGETIVAALERKDEELVGEAADLLFHLTVLLRERGRSLSDVAALLLERHRERGPERGPA